jgi:vacuolar-type H+-ATPase subunit H
MSGSQRRDLSKNQKRLRADTAERLESIVEAAERAAEKVIDDAEAQARRYLAEAMAEADRAADSRLSELAEAIEPLIVRAASLGREAQSLQLALEAAREGLREEEPEPGAPRPQSGPPREAEAPPEPLPPRLRAVGAQEEPASAPPDARDRAAGARLLATQLAVSGSSREEIAGRLRTGFEIEDATAILDAILGPEE